jgi:trans-aconitate methyltransferase
VNEPLWNAERYARNARFVADLGEPLLALLAPRPGERVLDLGCGDGAFTERIAASGADVTGFDSSPELLAAARSRGLRAVLGDGRNLAFDRQFDAVVSNAALHWMGEPDAVLRGVARALVPGGRFAGEFGGKGNVAAIVTALLAVLARRGVDGRSSLPWYFPTVAEYRSRLETSGFTVEEIELVPRPTPLQTGIAGWLETFAQPFFSRLPRSEHAGATAEAIDLLAPSLRDDSGAWTADYVRLRFLATGAKEGTLRPRPRS